jgi:hypothetical protein
VVLDPLAVLECILDGGERAVAIIHPCITHRSVAQSKSGEITLKDNLFFIYIYVILPFSVM